MLNPTFLILVIASLSVCLDMFASKHVWVLFHLFLLITSNKYMSFISANVMNSGIEFIQFPFVFISNPIQILFGIS